MGHFWAVGCPAMRRAGLSQEERDAFQAFLHEQL